MGSGFKALAFSRRGVGSYTGGFVPRWGGRDGKQELILRERELVAT